MNHAGHINGQVGLRANIYMSALEREIIEKFQQLQPAAKQRVRMIIDQQADAESQLAQTSAFDFAAWQDDLKAVCQQICDSIIMCWKLCLTGTYLAKGEITV
jgi:hypothetical protein